MSQPQLPIRPPAVNELEEHRRVTADHNRVFALLVKRIEELENQVKKQPVGWGNQ